MGTRCILLSFMLSLLGGTALGHKSGQDGVDSNFLIADGKVYFAQSDGSLTALNLDTGEVIARQKNGNYSGTLRIFGKGVLVSTLGELTLLDRSTLEVIWRAEEYTPVIDADRLVSSDGNGLVQCREADTLKVLWSYNLPGALDIVVQKGKVLLFRSAEFDGPEGVPAIVLLDALSGEELLHKTSPPNVHYINAYFDGENVYMPTGSCSGRDYGRSDVDFEKLTIWDLAGREVKSIPAPDSLKKESTYRDKAFTIDGKVFVHGGVWNRMEDAPPRKAGRGRPIIQESSGDIERRFIGTRFDFADGSVTVKTAWDYEKNPPERRPTIEVELKSAAGNWRGSLPYLKTFGTVEVVAASNKKIILGTNIGHVEAINRSDGQSQWIYIFPTMRHAMSHDAFYGESIMARDAALYRRVNAHKQPESGFMLEGASQPSRPKVVFDPEPANPYWMFPIYLTLAWAGVTAPILLTVIIMVLHRKRRLDLSIPAVWSLVLAIGTFCCFAFFGRVSTATAVGFRFSMAAPLLVSVLYAVRSLCERRRMSVILVLLVTVALGYLIFPVFLRL
jgi:hypothetical protein